jgi:hypothetical protein
MWKIFETLASEVFFGEIVSLQHGSHSAVKDKDSFFDGLLYF